MKMSPILLLWEQNKEHFSSITVCVFSIWGRNFQTPCYAYDLNVKEVWIKSGILNNYWEVRDSPCYRESF